MRKAGRFWPRSGGSSCCSEFCCVRWGCCAVAAGVPVLGGLPRDGASRAGEPLGLPPDTSTLLPAGWDSVKDCFSSDVGLSCCCPSLSTFFFCRREKSFVTGKYFLRPLASHWWTFPNFWTTSYVTVISRYRNMLGQNDRNKRCETLNKSWDYCFSHIYIITVPQGDINWSNNLGTCPTLGC